MIDWYLGLNIFWQAVIPLIGGAVIYKTIDLLFDLIVKKNDQKMSEKDKILLDERHQSGIFKGILGTLGVLTVISWFSEDGE
jgi:hypothetical protein